MTRLSAPAGSRVTYRGVLAAVWLISLLYLVPFVKRGWIPHDEGCLSHMAERVLAGELPHRDFDEIYSGGLTYLHALSFKVAGTNLVSMRYVLLIFTLLWIPAVYAIARRFASPVVSAAVSFLALVWSVPNYFASLPSWYNLFFATFGTLCLFRHIEDGRKRWLFLAGVCGGLSFLIKMVGIYYIAAGILFLLYREGVLDRSSAPVRRRSSFRILVMKAVVVLVFVCFLVFLLHTRPKPAEIVNLGIPALSVAAVLLWAEVRGGRGATGQRLRGLAALLLPFVLGVALPVTLFLLPYGLCGAIGDFFRGVFLLPQKRLANAAMTLPPLSAEIPILPYVLLLIFPFRRIARRREWIGAIVAAALLGLLLVVSRGPETYYQIWNAGRSIAVVAVCLACISLIAPDRRTEATLEDQQKVFALACVTALVALVQFPFGAPIYYCFVTPLAALTLLAFVETRRATPKVLHACVLAFFLLFAILRTNPGYVWTLGRRYVPYEASGRLRMTRGGLRVPAADEREYDRLLRLVRDHGSGPFIYAAPDCTEVYFLSSRRNPTRDIFDFLGSTDENRREIPQLLEQRNVKLIAIHEHPHFSPPINGRVRARLAESYPHSERIDNFEVRWKD